MKKALWNKTVLIIIALLACCISFSVALVIIPHGVQGNQIDICYETQSVRKFYSLNEEFRIPDATLKEGKTLYPAHGILTFPSGKTLADCSAVLSEAGNYKLEYRAIFGGRVLSASDSFTVKDSLYTITGTRSSAEYGYSPLVPHKKGIVVKLASGEEFVYNRVINLNELTYKNKLLSFFVIPETVGARDVSKVHITFTDVYDSSNFVTVTLKKVESNSGGTWAETTTYVVANAADQPPTGVRRGGSTEYKGKKYIVDSNAAFGTDFSFSLIGKPYSDYGTEEFSVSWDYSEKIVYGPDNSVEGVKMIIDLDEPAFFNDPWKGFTTGEAIMSISASNYLASGFNFVITELNGEDIKDKNYGDTDKPNIYVDYGDYDENSIPNAIIGMPYKLFPVTAADAKDGKLIVKRNVYYNYGGSNRVNVTVENDAFIPEQNRTYSIVYSAKDRAGNVATVVINVNTVPATEPLSVELSDYVKEGYAGQKISIATPSVRSLLNYYKVSKIITCGETRYETDENDEFIPLSSGTYNVRYSVENYVEKAETAYDIYVKPSDTPIFTEEPVLPEYFIGNCTYNLDVPNAYHFSDGNATRSSVSLSADFGDGYKTVKAEEFRVTASNSVSLRYATENKGRSAVLEYEIPIIDVGYGSSIRFTDYFKTESLTAKQERDGISFSSEENGCGVEFINYIDLNQISLGLILGAKSVGFGKLDVYFTNIADGNKTVKITFTKTETATQFSVNDGTVYSLKYVWGSGDILNVNVDLAARSVECGNRETTFITDVNQKPYSVSERHRIYISAVMSEIREVSSFKIASICNQFFGNTDIDFNGPQLITKDARGSYSKYDRITVSRIMASDMLDPQVFSCVYVKDPDNEDVISVDGVTLKHGTNADRDYEIVLSKVGRYMVTYEAVDGAGNPVDYSYAVNVVDKTPPTLEVNTDRVSANFGSVVKVKGYKVKDDIDKATVLITVTDPRQNIYSVENEFTANQVGIYTVSYYAYDESGNFTLKSYDVIVG